MNEGVQFEVRATGPKSSSGIRGSISLSVSEIKRKNVKRILGLEKIDSEKLGEKNFSFEK